MDALGYLVGAGSMSLGVEQAGFDLREIWETPGYAKNAQTWNLNRPWQPVNVLELDGDNYTHFWRQLGGQGIDLIYGNPPCGGVSTMTCSRIESPTNLCMVKWMRMVAPAGARMILMENGYQLATPRMEPLLNKLTATLDHYGYYWWTWMFYSYQIGCPQRRRRMFLCATKEPPKRAELVELTDLHDWGMSQAPIGPFLQDLVGVVPTPDTAITSSGEAVTQHWYDKLSVLEWNEQINKHLERAIHHYVTPRDFTKLEARLTPLALSGDVNAQRELEKARRAVWHDCPGCFHGMFMYRPYLLKWGEASQTIIGHYKYVHPIDRRFLTMREMARLMGYPDHWKFHKLNPAFIAQGIPTFNARWAADRLARCAGLVD